MIPSFTPSAGRKPIVSFIVPCYKLAHLLEECVSSILAQTYPDFEVLIMDDSSPDNTAEVANSFIDPRIRYVRNEENLGHLANYNHGIGLSRGKYIWLISADDRLRRPYVLERYVQLMEQNSTVGLVCCPGIGLQKGRETSLVDCGYFGDEDKIFRGQEFIADSLRKGYGLLAPTVMVRRDCYEKVSMFPLDMPHQGDLYLWYLWAIEYDVAYLCEPMVNYRSHELNMMKDLINRVPETVFRDEVNVLLRLKRRCEQKGFVHLTSRFRDALAAKYAKVAAEQSSEPNNAEPTASVERCERDLASKASSVQESGRLREEFLLRLANQYWRRSDFHRARNTYVAALRANWRKPTVWMRLMLLLTGLGPAAVMLRKIVRGRDVEYFLLASDNK